MSDFGLFLLMFAAVLVLVGVIKALSLFSQWLERPKIIPASAAPLVNRFAGRYVELRPVAAIDEGEDDDPPAPAPARTGAGLQNTSAPDDNAVRAGAQDAGAREAPPIVAFSTHQMQQAARRMIKHKMLHPDADMLNTIQAGFPEIKSRSGDPRSKYQLYGKPMYDALFAEPDYPTLEAQRRPSVVSS